MEIVFCNRDLERVPGGVVNIGELASEGVLDFWYHIYIVWPSVHTYHSSIWVHGQTLSLYLLSLSGMNGLTQENLCFS